MTTSSETLPIAERFVSINGEGLRTGQLSAFIRFAGCSLACSYCDTAWARDKSAASEHLTIDELVDWAFGQPTACITLTGGEPLEQSLFLVLADKMMRYPSTGRIVEIETNGACDIAELHALRQRHYAEDDGFNELDITLDWKLPSSGMAHRMIAENVDLLGCHDAVKFVCGSMEDLEAAKSIIDAHGLTLRTNVLLSPVFSELEPAAIVDFMKANAMRGERLQLQLHKIIWPGVEKGV